METTIDRYREINEHIHSADAQAPSSIVLALETFANGEEVLQSTLARSVDPDNSTTVWRALWLTSSLLIYAEGQALHDDWDAHSLEQNNNRAVNGTVRSWIRPLSQLTAITAENVQRTYRNMNFSTNPTHEADFKLKFGDPQAVVSLPFASTYSQGENRRASEEFVRELQKAWTATLS